MDRIGRPPDDRPVDTSGTTIESPQPPAAPERRLTRSRHHRIVAGVAGGLGEYLGVDPVLIRIAFVLLVFAGATGVLAYLLAWLFIPLAEADGSPPPPRPGRSRQTTIVLALVVIAAGVLALLGQLDGSAQRIFGTLLLLGGGGALLVSSAGRDVTRMTLGALLVLAGLASLFEITWSDAVSIDGFLAVALMLTGAGLIAGAWRGGPRGLVGVGVALTLLTSAATSVDLSFSGGVGDRVRRPLSVDAIQPAYRLGVGSLKLDLTSVDLPERALPIRARVGVGELIVTVPREASVTVNADTDAGEVLLFGRRVEGLDADDRAVVEGEEGGGRLVLDLHVGVGHVEVRRA